MDAVSLRKITDKMLKKSYNIMIARLTASATTRLVPASNRWRIQGTPMSPFWQSRNWVKTTRTTLTACLSRILMELQHILLEFRMWKQADAPTSTLCSPPPPTPTPMEGWHAMTTKALKWWMSRWRTPWSVLAPHVSISAVANGHVDEGGFAVEMLCENSNWKVTLTEL